MILYHKIVQLPEVIFNHINVFNLNIKHFYSYDYLDELLISVDFRKNDLGL